MLFQKDYVLRMIEMLGDFSREIMERLKDADAKLRLEEVSRAACGLSPALLEKTSAETLSSILSEAQRYFAAHLLLLRGRLAARHGGPEAQLPALSQAIEIFSTLTEADYQRPAARTCAPLVRTFLSDLSPETLLSAARAFENGGEFALSEDALYAASAPKEEIRAFYLRLLTYPDSELLSGGLPREEILESMEE